METPPKAECTWKTEDVNNVILFFDPNEKQSVHVANLREKSTMKRMGVVESGSVNQLLKLKIIDKLHKACERASETRE